MKIIGVTGPSGAGKTTLCDLLKREYNVCVIDADNIARNLSSDSTTVYFQKIVELFGNDILNAEGNLNRKKLASIIFEDEKKRKSLNNLTFKYVVEDIIKSINNLKNSNYDYIAIDVPLLYEAGMEKICDKVIAVIATDDEKISRICYRDNVTPLVAKQRLKIQNSNEFFAQKADFLIYNDGTIENLVNVLKEIMNKI